MVDATDGNIVSSFTQSDIESDVKEAKKKVRDILSALENDGRRDNALVLISDFLDDDDFSFNISDLFPDKEGEELNSFVKSANSRGLSEDGVLFRVLLRAQSQCHESGVLKTVVNRESKVIGRFPNYSLKCRDVWLEAFVKACHPSIGRVIGDVESCLKAAAAAAGLALIINPGLAWPTFKLTFYGCIQSKVGNWGKDITLSLDIRTTKGPWGAC